MRECAFVTFGANALRVMVAHLSGTETHWEAIRDSWWWRLRLKTKGLYPKGLYLRWRTLHTRRRRCPVRTAFCAEFAVTGLGAAASQANGTQSLWLWLYLDCAAICAEFALPRVSAAASQANKRTQSLWLWLFSQV